jgi:hypothetical protein
VCADRIDDHHLPVEIEQSVKARVVRRPGFGHSIMSY